ncbi:MAG: tail fiber domain-containing protein [Cytophagales bacterium]|nr:tail fiber domain-containing protein [Cytophagales bacterium]
MKKLWTSTLFSLVCFVAFSQSTTLTPGSILPNMTSAQRIAVVNPPNGMLVFDSNTQSYWFRQNSAWVELPKGGSTSNYWELNGLAGNELKNTNSGGFWSANASIVPWNASDVSNPAVPPVTGSGTRLMWIPNRSAIRIGTTTGDHFDANNLGLFSTGLGYNVRAAKYGVAIGQEVESRAFAAVAIGSNLVSKSVHCFTVGVENDTLDNAPFSVGTDSYRIFQVGNGFFTRGRSNALTILRGGNIGTFNVVDPKANLHLQYNSNLNWDAHLRLQYDENDWGNIVYDFDGFKFRTFGSNDDFIFRNAVGSGTQVARIFHTGNMTIAGTLTQNSDRRLKTNLAKVQNSGTKLAQLQAYHYNWIAADSDQSLQTGLIAQEVQKQFPELVNEGENGYLSVNYIGLIPHLIEANNELLDQNKLLTDRLNAIENLLKINQEGKAVTASTK